MRPLSEREQTIFEAVSKTESKSLRDTLKLKLGDFSCVNFPPHVRILSVLSDRQIEMINHNRSGENLPPLLADLVEIMGAKAGQIIDEHNGFLYPGTDFCATFFYYKADGTSVRLRTNRKKFTKYVVEPQLSLVVPSLNKLPKHIPHHRHR